MNSATDQIVPASKVKFDFKQINVNIPAPTDARIRSLIDQSAKDFGLTTKQMPSGAGHDAQDPGPSRLRRHDLYPQHRRDQPLTKGILKASGH